MHKVILKSGREKSLLRRHPWVFSGAIARVEGSPKAGDSVRIVAQDGRFLALAAHHPESQISARGWDWHEDTRIDAGFFRERIAAAMQMREALLDTETGGAVRLIHGES